MRRLPTLSGSQVKLDQPPDIAKRITKSDKHQLDIQVIPETKSLKIETSKCEGWSGESWRQFLNRHLKLIAVTNSGPVFQVVSSKLGFLR